MNSDHIAHIDAMIALLSESQRACAQDPERYADTDMLPFVGDGRKMTLIAHRDGDMPCPGLM